MSWWKKLFGVEEGTRSGSSTQGRAQDKTSTQCQGSAPSATGGSSASDQPTARPSAPPQSTPPKAKTTSPQEDFESAARSGGDFDAAVTKLTGHVERNPTSADASYWRAAALFMKALGQVNDKRPVAEIVPTCEKAIADYTRVIELQPSHIQAYVNRIGVYQSLGRDADMTRDMEAVKKLMESGYKHSGKCLNSPTLRKWIADGRQ